MVAPYSPSEDDFEKLYEDLPALAISCERVSQTIKNEIRLIIFATFFFIIFGLAKNNFCQCV